MARPRFNGFGKRIRFEQLEPRCMLSVAASGNVLASVKGGSLYLQGDTGNNQIMVTANGSGSFTVAQYTGNTGTTVNGQTSVTLAGVTGNVVATFFSGVDYLEIDCRHFGHGHQGECECHDGKWCGRQSDRGQ